MFNSYDFSEGESYTVEYEGALVEQFIAPVSAEIEFQPRGSLSWFIFPRDERAMDRDEKPEVIEQNLGAVARGVLGLLGQPSGTYSLRYPKGSVLVRLVKFDDEDE